MPNAKMKFRKIAGNYQLELSCFADLEAVLSLDDAFWALNSIDILSLRMEKLFLNTVDSDHDGRIRSDEIRAAVRFVLSHLRDGSGFDKGSDVLALAAITPDSPEGPAILEAARLVLRNLGKPQSEVITLAEVRSDSEIKAKSYSNGDGVITADPEQGSEIAEAITLIQQCVGSVSDRSGAAGVDCKKIDQFFSESSAYIAWQEKEQEVCQTFGKSTATLWENMQKIQIVIDNYFLNSESLKFFSGEPERTAKKDLTADARIPADIRAMLEKSTLAAPNQEGFLDLSQPLNPLFSAAVLNFFAQEIPKSFLDESRLSTTSWEKLKQPLLVYGEWKKAAPPWSALYGGVDIETLKRVNTLGIAEQLKKLCADDLSANNAMRGIDVLHKLILYQRDLLKLLNNFVTLSELFDRDRPSPLQTGTLVMDGRRFTLAIPVNNLAEHKKLVEKSDICVLYLELFNKVLPPPVKTLAVAVTSGTMRNLFIGKSGIFFGADGGVFDAKVIAFIEQPVSVSEALKNPFYRFGSFIGDQLNKLFAARTTAVQKDLEKQINSGKLPAASAPAAPNSSMMLMGGGIGIAALGSSVAFITNQLKNVSVWDLLSVLLGILIVFGGPLAVISLVKLYRRDLSRFLEAAGCAVNRKMRLSASMGNFFTYTPAMPEGEIKRGDLAVLKIPVKKHFRTLKALFWLLVILLAFCLGVWCYRKFLKEGGLLLAEPRYPQETPVYKDDKRKSRIQKKVNDELLKFKEYVTPPPLRENAVIITKK